MQRRWEFRAARAVMFAAVCVLLAALGHVVMSGAGIPWWALVPGTVSIATAAWIVADRERSVGFVVVGTVVAQAELHTVFTLAQTMVAPSHTTMHHGHEMHGGSARLVGAHEMPGMLGGHGSAGMLAAHLLAALLCGLWLAYGERAVFAVLRAVTERLVLRLLLPVQVVVHGPRPRPTTFQLPVRQLLLVHAIVSRGPPRGTAVA
ncbi:hypothetical protein [Kribbella sp. NPDC051770]|uniref:hypothetical protein n=1 Tax=Kribbella sp. NPDC051770 TaxID=3155413 RepID=UPI00344400C1